MAFSVRTVRSVPVGLPVAVLGAPALGCLLDLACLDPGPSWPGRCTSHWEAEEASLKAKPAEPDGALCAIPRPELWAPRPLCTAGPGCELGGGCCCLWQLVACQLSAAGCVPRTFSAGPFLCNLKDLDPSRCPQAHLYSLLTQMKHLGQQVCTTALQWPHRQTLSQAWAVGSVWSAVCMLCV